MVPEHQFTSDGDVVHMHMLAKCGSNWADDPPSDEVGARALLDNLRGSKELEFLTLDKNDFSQAPEQLGSLVQHQDCKLCLTSVSLGS